MNESNNKLSERTHQVKHTLLYIPMLASILAFSSCGHETVQEAKQENIAKITKEMANNDENVRDHQEAIRKLKDKNAQLKRDKTEREKR